MKLILIYIIHFFIHFVNKFWLAYYKLMWYNNFSVKNERKCRHDI